ncbi:MAG: protein kinase domain-containing protein [Verrucomicrobiia bacterium]
MSEEKRCAQCGAVLPADAPQGLCPACLLKRGFATSTGGGDPNSHGSRTEYVPPPPAELAHDFPELEILEMVGRGGMGVVYKARQKRLDRLVALKILPPNVSRDAAFSERFTREAKALARLTHPNIVSVHDFGQTDGLFYFVMEFVDGMNLRQLLDTGKLSPKEALAIVPQICDALQYAHDKGIVHRDIKPENILLARDGTVKIADFGLAKLVGLEAKDLTITSARDVIGTPHYMAPEQIEHPQDVDHRADIYSLGVVFYQMLTGELPIGRFAPPSRKVQIDVRLDQVVLRALEKEPARRYQHASDVKTQVETIATTPPPQSGGGVPPAPAGAQPGRMNKKLLWFLRICLPAIFLIQAFRWWSNRESAGVWLPERVSDSIGEQYGEAQVRLTDVIQRGQVVLIKLVCDTAYRDHELLVRYSGPTFDYPANIVSQITNLEPKVDCLMSPSFLNGGRGQDVLAGSRELKDAPTYQIGFVLPDMTVAARVAEQVRRVHLGKPRGFKDSPSALLLFALHRRWGNDANGKPIVELLTGELIWQAKETGQAEAGLPSVAGAGQVPVKSDYIGQTWFPQGDSIEITSVVRTADRMSVRGRYSLVSHDTALLALYMTSAKSAGPEEARQRMQISKGAGYFDLVHTHLVPGLAHVSMYADGHPFAALYFGTKSEALEEGKASWITNAPSAGAETSSEAMSAVNLWLGLMDNGEYARSWETAAPYFQAVMAKDEWIARLQKVRYPLGKVISRQFSSSKFTIPGTWLEVKFDTSFDRLPAATEIVTFAKQSGGEWQAIGYLILPVYASDARQLQQIVDVVKECLKASAYLALALFVGGLVVAVVLIIRPGGCAAKERPKTFASLALGLFLVGVLGTILLMGFIRNDALPFIFGGIVLVLALVFGAIGWRDRLGKGIVIGATVILASLAVYSFHPIKSDYIGQTWFPGGDSIEITSVVRTKERLMAKGHYSLVSHDSALLALYITSTNREATATDPKQELRISKGAGDFELIHPHLVPGLPHISMYADGHPFAAFYFGTKAEALEESKASWITNRPPAIDQQN